MCQLSGISASCPSAAFVEHSPPRSDKRRSCFHHLCGMRRKGTGGVVAVSVVHEGNRQPRISDKSETCLSSYTVGAGRMRERRCSDGVRGGHAAAPRGASGSSQLRVSNYPTWSVVIARGPVWPSQKEEGGGRASEPTKVCHQLGGS